MRISLRLILASAVVAAGMISTVGPALGADTITVSCTNGFQRTVAAQAARGVAKSLTKFNEHRGSSVTCAAAPGAPRSRPASAWLTISCTNGFERTVNARAAGGITRALNAFNTRSQTGVTCAAA
ncbi:MAG TPA: hypothetical protein VMZ33_02730 [Candidatus Limnocylindrales bacterium]|nr:hypothetical protein [Candidatus Limnocylindrales bacterium]